MNASLMSEFKVNRDTHQIIVERDFRGTLDQVWAAWTEPAILDQWWAPKPYTNHTHSQEFAPGGRWLYYMQGPTGDVHWCLLDYETVEPKNHFSGLDAFCDENGNISDAKPRVQWESTFSPREGATRVSMVWSYNSLADLEWILEVGFQQGLTMAMEGLDALLEGN